MNEAKLRRFLLFVSSAAALAALFYLLIRCLLPWCLPFLLAFLVASLLEPAILYLQRSLRFRRGFSALLLTLTLLFLLGGLLSLLLSTLLSQLSALLSAAPDFLDALPAAAESLLQRVERFAPACPDWLLSELREQVQQAASDVDRLLRTLSLRALGALTAAASALPGFLLAAATCVLAIYFTAAAYPSLQNMLHQLPCGLRQKLSLFRSSAAQSLSRWLRAQLTLSLVTFFELLVGFLLMREHYALLLAFLITLLDALPVFGTGTALVPWAVFTLLFGFPPRAIILLALYLCTLLSRNILEPKLLSRQAGLPAIASLFAMYLGFCSFGLGGMILFPLLLLLIAQILHHDTPENKKETAS